MSDASREVSRWINRVHRLEERRTCCFTYIIRFRSAWLTAGEKAVDLDVPRVRSSRGKLIIWQWPRNGPMTRETRAREVSYTRQEETIVEVSLAELITVNVSCAYAHINTRTHTHTHTCVWCARVRARTCASMLNYAACIFSGLFGGSQSLTGNPAAYAHARTHI